MKLRKQFFYGMLFLSFTMFAACSQSKDNQIVDIPTVNASGIVSAASTHPVKTPLIASGNSNATGTCTVQRAGDGGLYWKISASGLLSETDGWYVVRPTGFGNNLGYFTFVSSAQGRTSSGRQQATSSVTTGTMIECYIDGPVGYAYTDPFPAP